MKNARGIKSILLAFLFVILIIVFQMSIVWQWIYPAHYPEIIKKNAAYFQHNPNLILAIIQTESKFADAKVSKKGAIGLMQIMTETADWIMDKGNFPDQYRKKLHEPAVNIELGSWYLRYLIELYDGNLLVALAAYNAGPGNVSRWLETNIWDGTYVNLKQIPFGETRHYLQRVVYLFDRYEQVYKDPYWESND